MNDIEGAGRGSSRAPAVEYTVGQAARMVGIPVATLRSWTQRYGLGPSLHRPGRHRHYSQTDLAVITRMVGLVRAGASPGNAARAARAVSVPVPALGDTAPVLAAAERLDPTELLAAIIGHFVGYGVVATWNRLCRPAFAEIERRQADGDRLIDVEHMLSWAVATSLHRVVPLLRPVAGVPVVVLACVAGETHSLPLEVLRAALAERGVPAVLLGASVPADALADAMAKQGPGSVAVLWSHTRETASPELARTVRDTAARTVAAGPGWCANDLPEGVIRVDSLEEAIDLLG
ncbi:MerR family transcriptional regulator [Nocardia vulneris]|uniref:Transcriptional regulator n=1 Tax=Nocardia vulneris TaxID=1141657 RepID=A0ABR4Z8D0_9NOCA|nr:MerR family transcriptional regulator [Nocardia vulneris]KIA61307.1 transcriptional regulator [Nocardia vulneris]